MATLTEVSYYMRRIIKWGSVGIVIIMLIPFAWGIVKGIYLKLNPPPPPAPTVKYGKLPKLKFLDNDPNYKPQFKLETIAGGLPKLANTSKVYFVTVNKSRILELDKIKPIAAILGFTTEPQKIDDQTYKFILNKPAASLTVDIIYNSYVYNFDWRSEPQILSAKDIPNNQQALLEARNFWQNLGLLASDLADGQSKITYLKIDDSGNVIPALSLSQANLVRADLFRSDKDSLKFVTTQGDKSPVNVLFSGLTDRNKRVVEANYAYSRILEGDFSTYPLKTVDQAWNEMQQGGYVAKKAGNVVTIRTVTLAYYESDQPQEFIQPVYVFEGDGGFIGYVPAISADYSQ